MVGIVRTIEALPPQTLGGTTYEFDSWSDGGAAPTASPRPPRTRPTPRPIASPAADGGTGLAATYFDNLDFTGTTVTRIDPTVNFDWGAAPAAGIGADTFSVRWTGQVKPQFSQTYTFYTQSDDGVRLWVNGQLLVEQLDRPRADREQRHDRAHGRPALRHPDGVLREHRRRDGAALVEQRLDAEGGRAGGARCIRRGHAPGVVAINFQPASAPVPAGYLADGGLVYGSRGNGQTYGWNADNTRADARPQLVDCRPTRRYDTLNHMQKPATRTRVWEIAVPNGTYTVRIVAGDASYFDSVFRIAPRACSRSAARRPRRRRWVEGTATVTVTDGRLTITNGGGASNNKICFVEITPQ